MYGMNPYGTPATQQAPMTNQAPVMPQTAMPQAPMAQGLPQPMMSGWPIQATKPVPAAWATPVAVTPEETYVENILRMNRGKVATVYTTNENNPEWAAKVFTGRVENAARDHVVLSDATTGMRYIVLMINIDYITFDEPLQFDPVFYRQ